MTQKTYNMKNGILHLGLVLMVALAALTGCKNNEPKDAKIESISFKQSVYEIMENNIDLNLKKELVVTPEGILDKEKITWKVDNEDVAEMSGNYLLPKGAGTVKVTATVQEKSATCTVEISEIPIESIKLTDMTLKVHEKKKIEYTTVPENIPIQRFTLKSSSSYYASIDADGIITAKYPGTFTITATAGDVTSQCTITIVEVPVKSVTLDRTSYVFTKPGETLQLIATVEPEDASFPDLMWGSSDNNVARVDPSTGLVTTVAPGSCTITVSAGYDGAKATCKILYIEQVTDACNNTYPVVYIGGKYWMAKNMRCYKYDSGSERPNESIGTKKEDSLTPRYSNANDYDEWDYDSKVNHIVGASDERLGYLYNWSAATATSSSGAAAQTTAFSGKRQGICPNGFHLPTISEYEDLAKAVGGVKDSDGNYKYAGKKLKTTDGWNTVHGTDDYGFSAFSSGYAYYKTEGYISEHYLIEGISLSGYFWTATPNGSDNSFNVRFVYYSDDMNVSKDSKKGNYAVRCVKN